MNSNVHSKLILTLFIAVYLCLQSCGRHPDQTPPPIINIVILDEWDAYLLDGQRVDRMTLETRLKRLADEEMREITGTSRARVRITSHNKQKSNRAEKNSLMKYCMAIGLDKIAFH